jgi:hypothetical protein
MTRAHAIAGILVLAVGCGGNARTDPRRISTLVDLHAEVFARSCSPAPGACHDGKEYPDLHTPRNLIDAIDMPCNAARIVLFDGCAGDWREIVPGRPDRSYLVGRITGTVPGTRMPLANAPLSKPEYDAILCWIAGLTSREATADDPIDYDRCPWSLVQALESSSPP